MKVYLNRDTEPMPGGGLALEPTFYGVRAEAAAEVSAYVRKVHDSIDRLENANAALTEIAAGLKTRFASIERANRADSRKGKSNEQ